MNGSKGLLSLFSKGRSLAAHSASNVQGVCDPLFNGVRQEFERNFEERGEIGASISICLEGEPVVDLWGGLADRAKNRAWEENTLANVFSSTKGLAGICMHMLMDRGLLDFRAPVSQYWPEFAANGKEKVTVDMVMSHQAGLPVFQEEIHDGAFHDWEFVTTRLANERPIWDPGTQHGYHAATLGFLEGEIVQRITGKTIGQFLRDEVAEPLGADIWIGLPESEESRVATSYLSEPNPNSPLVQKMEDDPDWIGAKMVTNSGNDITPDRINSRERHAAEIPAAGGIANARALARVYAPLSLDGSVNGISLVSEETIPLMSTVRSASSCDNILRVPTTFTLGFSKSWGERRLGQGEFAILGEHAFGTIGMGGSYGFADRDTRMSFGYTMNLHGSGVGLNDRGQSLIDAAYQAAGYRTSKPGFWVR